MKIDLRPSKDFDDLRGHPVHYATREKLQKYQPTE